MLEFCNYERPVVVKWAVGRVGGGEMGEWARARSHRDLAELGEEFRSVCDKALSCGMTGAPSV